MDANSQTSNIILFGAGLLVAWYLFFRTSTPAKVTKPADTNTKTPTPPEEQKEGFPRSSADPRMLSTTQYLPERNPLADIKLVERAGVGRVVRGLRTRDARGEPSALKDPEPAAPTSLQNVRLVEALIDNSEVNNMRPNVSKRRIY